jgi:hypothetical protein
MAKRYIKRSITVALVAGVPLLGATGCDDWLTGPKVGDDPNRPTQVTADLLLNGIQSAQFVNLTGQLARLSTMWTQQFAGTERQFSALDRYGITEDELTGEFSQLYASGGLLDIRQLQDSARARGDDVYLGVAQVWEALVIGTAASIWGDIPYSQAVNVDEFAVPQLDEQEDVYAAVQALLDEAITNLGSSAGPGPGGVDLVYRGDADAWIEAAHSLKARFYMHWAEAQLRGDSEAATACGGDCIDNAISAAGSGISDPANDFLTYQSSNAGEENVWNQFMFRERVGYIAAGAELVDLLKDRSDPRLTAFFRAPNGSTAPADIVGVPPGQASSSAAVLSVSRGAAGFRQPVITWAETRLLLAEATFYNGDPAAAATILADYRADAGLAGTTPVASGTLAQIAEELYLALFQNIEAKNVYERTCYPNLSPALDASGQPNDFIPGRFYYGVDERNANENIPAPDTPGNTLGPNDNDWPGGTVNPAPSCLGQNYADESD